MFNLLVSTLDLFWKLSKRKIICRQKRKPKYWVFGHLRWAKHTRSSGNEPSLTAWKSTYNREVKPNKEMTKLPRLLTLWDPLTLAPISSYFKTPCSGNGFSVRNERRHFHFTACRVYQFVVKHSTCQGFLRSKTAPALSILVSEGSIIVPPKPK